MTKGKNAGIEFVVNSNVHIEVLSPQNVIRQTVDKHNKATKRLVGGLLRFIRGEFNTTNKRTNENTIVYADEAKGYIPCYIGFGTGGVKLTSPTEESPAIPDYDPVNRRLPPLTNAWKSEDNKVQYSDTKLNLEITQPTRCAIGVMKVEDDEEFNSYVGDIQQVVFGTDIEPGYYSNIYGITTDVFLTEIGLFAGKDPNDEDLLARVLFKDNDTVLYVRPQDTILVRWTISIIALNELSVADNDIVGNGINIPVGSVIDDTVDYNGTISKEEDANE